MDNKFLNDLIKKETVDSLIGKHKEIYKLAICGIFINIIGGRHATEIQSGTIEKAIEIRNTPRKILNLGAMLNEVEKVVHTSLENAFFKKPYDNQKISMIINFFRARITDQLDNGRTLFQAKELDSFLDYRAFLGYDNLFDYHWIEFNLLRGLIPTIPEAIIFNDLKVQWNFYLEVLNSISSNYQNVDSFRSQFDFFKEKNNRELLYIESSSRRNLMFIGVTFVEAYLFHLFLSVKENTNIEKEIFGRIIHKFKISDREIVEKILFKLDSSYEENLGDIYQEYCIILEYRDRYVHASPFPYQHDHRTSQLQPLLNISHEDVINALQTSVDFVKKIDNLLAEDLKILWWWYDGEISFIEEKPLNLTNDSSRIEKIEFS
jgi:hypothetical protein